MAGGRAGGRALAQTCSALITTSVTAPDVESMKAEIKEAEAGGADVVELRLDFLGSLDPERDIRALLDACSVPAIVTLRPTWEGCDRWRQWLRLTECRSWPGGRGGRCSM